MNTSNNISQSSQTPPLQPSPNSRPFPKKLTQMNSNEEIEEGPGKPKLKCSSGFINACKFKFESKPEVYVAIQKAKIFEGFKAYIANKYPEIYPIVLNYNYITITEYFETGTPCHFAVLNSDDVLLYKVIKLGADIHQKDEYSETALIAACRTSTNSQDAYLKTRKCIHFFVEGGSDLLLKDRSGKRPLEYLCEIGYFNEENILEILRKLTAEQLIMIATVLHSTHSIKVADFFIQSGISKEALDNEGFTPLMRAIERRNISLIEYFLNLECDFLKEGPRGESALEMLAKHNLFMDKRLIPYLKKFSKEKLTSAQIILFPTNYREISPAFYNVSFGKERLELIEFLINEKVVCVNCFDDTGNTPLYMAVYRDDTSYIQFLCDNGANPDIKKPPLPKTDSRKDRTSPVYDSCGALTPQELLNHKQQLVDNRLYQIYKKTINSDLDAYTLRNKKYNTTQQIFIQARCRIIENRLDLNNLTAELPLATFLLHTTANPKVVDTLINQGFTLNIPHNGFTPLNSALWRSDWKMVEHLLSLGADPHFGLSFHALAGCRDLTRFDFFVKMNVDINQTDIDGNNALMKICQHMLYFGKDETIIPQKAFLMKIIFMGCDMYQKNHFGICPLIQIAKNRLLGDKDILDLVTKIPEQLHTIPELLHQAINPDLINYLIDYGINIDSRDSNGNTALYLAAARLDYISVVLLITRGADSGILQPSLSSDYEKAISSLQFISMKKEELVKKIELIQSDREKLNQLAQLKIDYNICQNIETLLYLGEHFESDSSSDNEQLVHCQT